MPVQEMTRLVGLLTKNPSYAKDYSNDPDVGLIRLLLRGLPLFLEGVNAGPSMTVVGRDTGPPVVHPVSIFR